MVDPGFSEPGDMVPAWLNSLGMEDVLMPYVFEVIEVNRIHIVHIAC